MDHASHAGLLSSATRRRLRRCALAAIALAAASIAPAGTRSLRPPGPSASPTINGNPAPSYATFNRATPALWEVRDGDTTIFLFGTFHTLDKGTLWFDRSVRAAFDQSGELVLETIVPLDPVQARAVGRAVIGPRPATNSFLGQTSNAVKRGEAAGLSVDRGADSVLRRAAAIQGKSLSGIEAFSEQLRTFSRIPATAPEISASILPQRAPVTLNQLLVAWKAGDTHAFSTMLAGFEAKSPTAYRMLITDRNALYGNWIVDRLDQPGTVFVALGSGHLAGKDSVQNWLWSKGIVARRVG